MTIRPARLSDFAHLETFVWQAIFPAFDVPGLTPAQRAENDALVENARGEIADALDQPHGAVYVAIEPKLGSLAGYIVVDAKPGAYAEIRRLLVKRAHRGKGVGALLLNEATKFIGTDRAVSLAIRHYNARAIAFFEKHGFVNTEEPTGLHAIPRMLLLREANTVNRPMESAQKEDSFGADFPSASDEPIYEALPDYRLATDETPLFATGENALTTEIDDSDEVADSSLTEEQLSVLESFIAKARAKKAGKVAGNEKVSDKKEIGTHKKQPTPDSAEFKRKNIPFEVDFGNQKVPPVEKKPQTAAAATKSSFAFDFAPVREVLPEEGGDVPSARDEKASVVEKVSAGRAAPAPNHSPEKKPVETKNCPDCATALPVGARFCYVCGMPQTTPETSSSKDVSPPEEQLELRALDDVDAKTQTSFLDTETNHAEKDASTEQTVAISDLRKAFKVHLCTRLIAYFGEHAVQKYLVRLEDNIAFQQVRDGSLSSLARWLNGRPRPSAELAQKRKHNTFADLAEYFIVETAGDLSGNLLPQRLLRHQSVDWKTADIFKLVLDYLDFDKESETVYTDFVSMPPRALKNATRSFLQVAKDERVYFICDQSILAQGKNGFAITDAGIYWKNILQPPGAATFTTIQTIQLDEGHILIDGQFFNAGGKLNLKVAVLLDKLRRMDLS